MTWTYTLSTLSTTEKDQIRLEVGDTDTNRQLLQDEEIEFAIGVEDNYWGAAARCAEMVARWYLTKIDTRLGRAMQVQYTTAAKQYAEMARLLRCKANGTRVPYGGGIYGADKNTIAGDTDLVAPAFSRTMQENPWTGGYTSDSLSPTTGANQDT